MGFGKKFKHVVSLTHKASRRARKKLGLTAKNKWTRQLKRSLHGGSASYSYQPTSASDYIYRPRTLSQLMGGT